LEITATEDKAAAEPEITAVIVATIIIALVITRVIIYGMIIFWIRIIPRRESDSISFSREDKGGQWT
jgi:hypothetical protein